MVWSNNWDDVRPTRTYFLNDSCFGEGSVWGKARADRDHYSHNSLCPAWDGASISGTRCSRNNERGDGSATKRIQTQLNKVMRLARPSPGVPAQDLVVDGILGAKSDIAIKWFQKSRNLVDDGLVGSATWGWLYWF